MHVLDIWLFQPILCIVTSVCFFSAANVSESTNVYSVMCLHNVLSREEIASQGVEKDRNMF